MLIQKRLIQYLTNNYFEAIIFAFPQQVKEYYEFYLATRSEDSTWVITKNKDVVILTDDIWVIAYLSLCNEYDNLEFNR